jgi:hypothetical protein
MIVIGIVGDGNHCDPRGGMLKILHPLKNNCVPFYELQ